MSDTLPTDHEVEQLIEPLPKAEEESFELADTHEPIPPPDIVAYNEVRSCADLFRLYSSGKMEIQPDFQREVVWKKEERARFIDSLVKQLPIPSMCFSLDPRNQRWKVIDGLQRMTSIVDFLGPKEWRLAALDDIHPLLRGHTNVELRSGNETSTILYSAVENVTVPVTVIRCDYSKGEHMAYLFTIFHRLNSGGVRLNNQEIRNCIYSGTFNDTLKGFDVGNADWQVIKSRIWGSVSRFRSVEILLRLLAFSDSLGVYDGNLAAFLNNYMQRQLDISKEAAKVLSERLGDIARLSREALETSGSGKLSLATIEAVLVGISVNLGTLMAEPRSPLTDSYEEMLKRPAFAEGARYAVSSVENVRARLGDAISAFKGVS
jgi:hypothetical protein